MTLFSNRHVERFLVLTILFLAMPAIAVRIWLTFNFPSYLGWEFVQDVLFALVFCSFLSRGALASAGIGFLAVRAAVVCFLVALVFSEGVSYFLQADTFNDRLFGNVDPNNLRTGIHAFPWMIGGGLILSSFCLVPAGWLLRRLSMNSRNALAAIDNCHRWVLIIGLTATGGRAWFGTSSAYQVLAAL